MTTPQVGDFAVTPTYGSWRDRVAAWFIRYGTNSPVNHAFLYVGAGKIVEAAPGGARLADLSNYDPGTLTWSTGLIPLTDTQRNAIAAWAVHCEGIPYGWLDILAISLAQHRAGQLVDSHTWWVKRIASTRTLICSQLVDESYKSAGVDLFNDGRLPGLVSPGDLYRRLQVATVTNERKAA